MRIERTQPSSDHIVISTSSVCPSLVKYGTHSGHDHVKIRIHVDHLRQRARLLPVIQRSIPSTLATFVRTRLTSHGPISTHFSSRRDQLVTLTTTTPHTAVRIVGITPDYGLLRTIPERSGMPRYSSSAREDDYIDLQPDGNSFDLMANLIKSKS